LAEEQPKMVHNHMVGNVHIGRFESATFFVFTRGKNGRQMAHFGAPGTEG
jgi:hypothetical protein